MVDKESICRLIFSYFYEKVYKVPCPYAVLESEQSQRSYERFIIALKRKYSNSVGANFIWNYVSFTFGRYISKIEENDVGFAGKITPVIVFGSRARQVYEERNTKMDFITSQNALVTKYKVSQEECSLKKGVQFKTSVPKKNNGRLKDPIKQVASASENALETCIDMTDLYNPQDVSCRKCLDKEKCWLKLEELYPKLFKERSNL